MGSIFINYRRGETAGEARALFNELAATLGKDSVFMDVDNVTLGRDFRQVLHDRLASCDLMLALIGKDWVDAKNPSGRRRLACRVLRYSDIRPVRCGVKAGCRTAPLIVQTTA
jgi:hypothetical protein